MTNGNGKAGGHGEPVPTGPDAIHLLTQNRVQAAPVRIARFHLTQSRGLVSAVLINAGNANCATRTGDRVAQATVRAAAKALGVKPEYILPASTGVIGVEMDGGDSRRVGLTVLSACSRESGNPEMLGSGTPFTVTFGDYNAFRFGPARRPGD